MSGPANSAYVEALEEIEMLREANKRLRRILTSVMKSLNDEAKAQRKYEVACDNFYDTTKENAALIKALTKTARVMDEAEAVLREKK